MIEITSYVLGMLTIAAILLLIALLTMANFKFYLAVLKLVALWRLMCMDIAARHSLPVFQHQPICRASGRRFRRGSGSHGFCQA